MTNGVCGRGAGKPCRDPIIINLDAHNTMKRRLQSALLASIDDAVYSATMPLSGFPRFREARAALKESLESAAISAIDSWFGPPVAQHALQFLEREPTTAAARFYKEFIQHSLKMHMPEDLADLVAQSARTPDPLDPPSTDVDVVQKGVCSWCDQDCNVDNPAAEFGVDNGAPEDDSDYVTFDVRVCCSCARQMAERLDFHKSLAACARKLLKGGPFASAKEV
jgi:hypothetical protein